MGTSSPRDANVNTDETAPGGDFARRVIPFRPRAEASPGKIIDPEQQCPSPIADLAKFERTKEQEDYRHRMIVNAAALAFTVLLVAAGIWLADAMAVMRKNQDCVLMGRTGCSPIQVPPGDRWSASISGQQQ